MGIIIIYYEICFSLCLWFDPSVMNRYAGFILMLLLPVLLFGQDEWKTFCEQSGFKRTPGYAETMAYCRRLDEASPVVSAGSFGVTAQGRDLVYLVADRDGYTDPRMIRDQGRIIVMIQACIHPGESEGKDAGLMLFRDLVVPPAPGSSPPMEGLLDRLSILFIPIFNADGHERFGPYNRINQNGPEEMGWRVTANNLNLNRDFLKADAPEMKAWLRLFNGWLPEFFIDTHTTDGADYEYPLTYLIEVFGGMDDGLTAWSKDTFNPRLEALMQASGYPVFPYVDFRNWHDPRSGLISEVSPPMLSQGYTALRNRPGLLIETHMLKPYQTRVNATYECLAASLTILNQEAGKLAEIEQQADEFVCSRDFLSNPFPLRFQAMENDSVMVPFKGYEYTLEKSDISGGTWFNYSQKPVVMNLPWFRNNQPVFSVNLPVAYIIPVEWKDIIDLLEVHGIRISRLRTAQAIPVTTCRFRNPKWQSISYEGRHILTQVEYDEVPEVRSFPAGSAVVETSQQAARILAHLLEPKGSGSLVSWGFFDAVFEQKEYAENYVLEKMAARMLAEDTALKQEFELKKANDPSFASNPQQILNWFYSKSPYIDQRRGMYPVGKIFSPDLLNSLDLE